MSYESVFVLKEYLYVNNAPFFLLISWIQTHYSSLLKILQPQSFCPVNKMQDKKNGQNAVDKIKHNCNYFEDGKHVLKLKLPASGGCDTQVVVQRHRQTTLTNRFGQQAVLSATFWRHITTDVWFNRMTHARQLTSVEFTNLIIIFVHQKFHGLIIALFLTL